MRRILNSTLSVLIWTAVAYFEISLIILAISMFWKQSVKFFIFSVDTVPTGDPGAKMIFLIVVLLSILGFIALIAVDIYFRLQFRKTKNTQSENHSS